MNDGSILLERMTPRYYYLMTYLYLHSTNMTIKYWDTTIKTSPFNGIDFIFPASKIINGDKMYGYLNTAGKEAIPFIFDYAHNFNNTNFAIVQRFGIKRAVDKKGNLYISLKEALEDGKLMTRKRYTKTLDDGNYEVTEEEYIYHASKLSSEKAKVVDFPWADFKGCFQYMPIKVDGSWWLQKGLDWYDPEDEPTYHYQSDRILYLSNGYFAYRRNNICYLLNLMKPEIVSSFNYDEIIPIITWKHTYQEHFDTRTLISIIVCNNGKYGLIGTYGEILLPIIYDKIELTDAIHNYYSGAWGVIYKGGKCCLVDLERGYIPDDICYDEIIENIVNEYRDYSIASTFIVRKDLKYGCRDTNWNEIVPTEFDKLEFNYNYPDYSYSPAGILYSYRILKYIENKIGTVQYRKFFSTESYSYVVNYTFSSKAKYDECVFLNNKDSIASYGHLCFIGVRIGEKWGILDATPAEVTYYPQDDSDWNNAPNYEDLEYKYDSLESLIADVDNEFKRRYKKYHKIT